MPAHRPRHKPRGRHPQHRLSAVAIRHTHQPGRYADGNGLYLVVDPSGAKRWSWRGIIQGKRCELGLGSVQIVSLAAARDAAITIKRTAHAGDNPLIARRRAQRTVPTFAAAARAVHAEHSPHFKNLKHRAQWITTLETYAFPLIGDRPVNTITTDSGDVLAVLSPIWTETPETARRVKQRLKLVFDWCKAKGYCLGNNPTEGVIKALPKLKADKAHHAALPYRDVPAFVSALQTLADLRPAVRGGLELLILTATRTNELREARWTEVDLRARTWTIPAARMKADRAHTVPLSDRAIAILEQARARADPSPWIFPGDKPGKPLSNMTLLKAARRVTTTPLTVHGFRSSFRDWSAERTNIPRDVCEAALAHTVRDKTEAAYKRTTLFDKRRELMDLWAQFVTSTPATVIAIRA
jgi:integrase